MGEVARISRNRTPVCGHRPFTTAPSPLGFGIGLVTQLTHDSFYARSILNGQLH